MRPLLSILAALAVACGSPTGKTHVSPPGESAVDRAFSGATSIVTRRHVVEREIVLAEIRKELFDLDVRKRPFRDPLYYAFRFSLASSSGSARDLDLLLPQRSVTRTPRPAAGATNRATR